MITPKDNLKAFHDQIRAIIKTSKKTAAEQLNKRSIQVLIGSKGFPGAVQLTPKTTKARLRADLNKKFYASKSGKPVKLLWILASKRLKANGENKGPWRPKVAGAAVAIAAARDQSRAFLAAGWLNAVVGLGRTTNTGTNRSIQGVKVKPGGKASESFGVPATESKLRTHSQNAAAGPIGSKGWNIANVALMRAITSQTRDMEQYLKTMIEKAAKKHADKH